MCEGETLSHNRPSRRDRQALRLRRRRRQEESPKRVGVDIPPPVASPATVSRGVWEPRACVSFTPEFLATLRAPNNAAVTWSCAPLIVAQQWILVGTEEGEIFVWSGDKMFRETQLDGDDIEIGSRVIYPDHVVKCFGENEVSGPIVHLSVSQANASKVVAASDMGKMVVLTLTANNIDKIFFSTKRLSATCCTFVGKSGLIIVGFQSGYLEGWKLRKKDLTTSTREQPVTLMFRGVYENGNHIQSVAQLLPKEKSEGSKGMVENKAQVDGLLPTKEYLILTMESDRQLATSCMIDVLDLESLVSSWNDQTSKDHTEALENHFILPEAGMEIIDTSSSLLRSNHQSTEEEESYLPEQVHWIPNRQTHCIIPIDTTDELDCNVCCAVSLSDGTAMLVSAELNASDDTLSWGIARNQDQMLLSYPAFGAGTVQLSQSAKKPGPETWPVSCPYAVFCLSGSTTYLAPIGSSSQDLRTTFYPHEVDSDSPVENVQGFAAGNVTNREAQSNAVLVYGWPDGLLDIYSCQLLRKDFCPRSTIVSLMERGTAELLRSLLFSEMKQKQNEEDRRSTPVEWMRPYEELKAAGSLESEFTVDDICSQKLERFRALLLSFGQTDRL